MMQKSGHSGSLLITYKWSCNLGMFNTAIYGKTVRCSFKSFERCISEEHYTVSFHFSCVKTIIITSKSIKGVRLW